MCISHIRLARTWQCAPRCMVLACLSLIVMQHCPTAAQLSDPIDSSSDDEMEAGKFWKAYGSFNHSATLPADRLNEPHFLECAKLKMVGAANNCGGSGCRLVLVGDSITLKMSVGGMACYAGQPSRHHSYPRPGFFPDHWRPLIIAGACDQTHHTLGHLARCLPVLKTPQVFFIMVGTNNLGPNGRFGVEKTALGVQAVIQYVRSSHPMARVLVHPILPRGDVMLQAAIDGTNAAIQAFAELSEPEVKYIDCSHVFRNGNDNLTRLQSLTSDMLHPNALGIRTWLGCLRPKLAPELGEAAGSRLRASSKT